MIKVIKKLVRKLTMYPTAEHLHKDCQGIDDDDPRGYCCSHCACCPCHSWRCGVCLWYEKPVFRSICDWAWIGKL